MIAIKEIEDAIKDIFSEAEIMSIDSVYEKIEGSSDLKLVIFFNRLLGEDISLLYTKLIFIVDENKVNLSKNNFLYLYEINCEYVKINFNDLEDFKTKLKNIFDKKQFGDNIQILSKFIESPAFFINEWFKDNKVNEISVLNVKYDPKVHILPCKSLFFSFDMDVSNNEIKLTITKQNNGYFNFSFKINDDIINIEKTNLNTIVETIGETLKNNIK